MPHILIRGYAAALLPQSAARRVADAAAAADKMLHAAMMLRYVMLLRDDASRYAEDDAVVECDAISLI